MFDAAKIVKSARWMLTSAALLSSASWLLSVFVYVSYYWSSGGVHCGIDASAGIVTYRRSEPTALHETGFSFMRGFGPHTWRYWKFYLIRSQTASGSRFSLGVPLWAPLAATAIPALLLWRPVIRAARRRRAGQCVACGYDRAGLLTTAACPECGEKPAGG